MSKDPNRAHSEVIENICKVCNSRYSFQEAKDRNMTCCGRPLQQIHKSVSVPLGP